VILLVDECGFCERPLVRRTWARRGRTPVLQQEGSWKKLSALAALSLQPSGRVNEQFQLFRHNVRVEDFLWFLHEARCRYRKPLIVVWDGLPRHRELERLFERLELGWAEFERLPAYAPDTNPVESLWSQSKGGELANFAPHDLDELQPEVDGALAKAKSRPRLLKGFFRSAGLDPTPVENFSESQ
jgi:hypothetical protein